MESKPKTIEHLFELLDRDRKEHDMIWADGFHNHMAHGLVALYLLGGS